MNPSPDLELLRLRREADLARLLRRADWQGHVFVVCCLVVTLAVGWALIQ